MEDLGRGILGTLKQLWRERLFTTCVVVLLALGIGLNGVVFTAFDTLVLRSVPSVAEPHRVAAVFSQDRGAAQYLPISFLDYRDYRDNVRSFRSLAARRLISMGCVVDGLAEPLAGELVSANYFETLGLRPALGRFFLPEEDRIPKDTPAVVVSHDFWRQRLGGGPGVLGQILRLNGQPFQIVGVAPEGFHGPDSFTGARVWVPLSEFKTVTGDASLFESRGRRTLLLLGRLAPGVTLKQAAHEMKSLAIQLARIHPDTNRDRSVVLFPLPEVKIFPGQQRAFVRAGLLLLVMTGVLLLAACANVGSLMLARAIARQKDWAVLLSLGARTGALLRQVLAEGLLIAFMGGAVSLAVLTAGVRALWIMRPLYLDSIPLDLSLDSRVVGFVAGLALLAGVLFSGAPLVYARRAALTPLLKGSGHGIVGVGRGLRALNLLVLLQVALAMLSLGCAGFCLGSYLTAQTFDPGFDADGVVMLSFDLRTLGYDEVRGRQRQDDLVRIVRSLPGVRSVSLSENRLLGGFRLYREVHLPGHVGEQGILAGSSIVDAVYFATTEIPLLRGRAFMPSDRAGAARVAILNENLAAELFSNEDPVGRTVLLDQEDTPVEVVGVAKTVPYRSPGERPQSFLYLPLAQRYAPGVTLLVRGAPASGLASAVRDAFRKLDPQLPVLRLQTADDAVQESLWAERTGAVLLAAFSVLVLLLAVVGLYGLTAYSVVRRQSEIALRMVLGADRRRIILLMLRQGLVLIVSGITLGGLATFNLLGWAAPLFHAGPALRSVVVLLSALILAIAGLLANIVPASRATRYITAGLPAGRFM